VTGAAKRIGRAIVEDLAANGFAVAVHANGSIEAAEDLVAELRQKGFRAISLKADLKDIAGYK
jgi:NAD(P)-dependent dehydrogenase (short-subunit alcohol dehydrogenase family)